MRRKRPFGTILAVMLLGAASCGDGEPPSANQAPATREVEWFVYRPGPPQGLPLEPHVRHPVGSQLRWLTRDGRQKQLPADMAAMGDPVLTLDGARFLFVGKSDEAEKYGIWSCRVDGTDLRRVVEVNADCGAAAELPDGRVVYSRAVPGPPPLPDLRSRWALYVKGPDEVDGRRITFGTGLAIDPSVLQDGRILYSAYQPDGGIYLWTVHPDGTGAARVPGPHGGVPYAVRALQIQGGDVVFTVLGEEVAWRRIDWRAPGAGSTPVDPAGTAYRRPTTRPQGHLSMVRVNVPWGQVVGLDAGADARSIRFSALDGEAPRLLGDVPLAADGSFFVRLPPDVPLVLETLDESGAVIRAQQTPFWVRPNETRACVGCHEDAETAPPNRRPLAVLEDPVDLSKGSPR